MYSPIDMTYPYKIEIITKLVKNQVKLKHNMFDVES